MYTRKDLRPILAERFPSDEDFDAFCLDCFENIHFKFTVGMSRVTKTSLLLEGVAPDKIADALGLAPQPSVSPQAPAAPAPPGPTRSSLPPPGEGDSLRGPEVQSAELADAVPPSPGLAKNPGAPTTGSSLRPPSAERAWPGWRRAGAIIGAAMLSVSLALVAFRVFSSSPTPPKCAGDESLSDNRCLYKPVANFIACVKATGLQEAIDEVKSSLLTSASLQNQRASVTAERASFLVSKYENLDKDQRLKGCLLALDMALGRRPTMAEPTLLAPKDAAPQEPLVSAEVPQGTVDVLVRRIKTLCEKYQSEAANDLYGKLLARDHGDPGTHTAIRDVIVHCRLTGIRLGSRRDKGRE